MNVLTAREKIILTAIIEDYIKRKEPIGSRTLFKDFDFGISTATIRNTMMDLEDKGLVQQPHTSAGRVPTDAGYRLYVADLMTPEPLSQAEVSSIRQTLLKREMSIDSILVQAAQIVSMISKQLGIVLAPCFEEGTFDQLQLVRIHSDRLMLVLAIRSKLIKTVIMEIESDLDDNELIETSEILNRRLHGLTISEVRKSIRERMTDFSQGNPKLISLIIDQVDFLFRFDDLEMNLQYGITSNLLEQPEFLDVERLKSLLKLLEDRELIIKLLKEIENKKEDTTIIIGHENKEERLQDCSIVVTHYSIGDVTGILSVIGPTRMSYARQITLVNYTSKILSQVFSTKNDF